MEPSNPWAEENPWKQPTPSPSQGTGSWNNNPPPPPGGPDGPETPQGPSKKPVIITFIVILALAVVGGGGWYLGQRSSSEETSAAQEAPSSAASKGATATSTAETSESTTRTPEETAPSKGSCDEAIAESGMRRPASSFCDGTWALVGDTGTDHTKLFYWTGDSWRTYENHGHHSSGALSPCYARDTLVEDKVPSRLVNKMYQGHLLCDDTPSSSGDDSPSRSRQNSALPSDDLPPGGDWLPYPPCDGSYALIVDSVVVSPGQDPKPLVRKSLAAHPGAEATYPDQCAAFRGRVDGAYVYPVYIKYGNDLAGVCAAENRGEGNARKLQRVADYSSPC